MIRDKFNFYVMGVCNVFALFLHCLSMFVICTERFQNIYIQNVQGLKYHSLIKRNKTKSNYKKIKFTLQPLSHIIFSKSL